MRVFGPKYPPQLQAVMNHAERFCELLAELERRRPTLAVRGRKWLVRRRGEIEAVLSLIVGDLAADRISIRGAARSVTSYLDELHAGAQQSLGLEGPFECCDEHEAVTAYFASKKDAVTVEAVTRFLGDKAQARIANETWLVSSAVLDAQADAGGPGGRGSLAMASSETLLPSTTPEPGKATS
jgi:hypothetical protein